MKIQFIESPTGSPFYLAYSAGTFADLPDNLAASLIQKGLAVEVAQEKRITNAEIVKHFTNAEISEKRAAVPSNNPTSKRTSTKGRGEKSS
jgi:hypothetical protein